MIKVSVFHITSVILLVSSCQAYQLSNRIQHKKLNLHSRIYSSLVNTESDVNNINNDLSVTNSNNLIHNIIKKTPIGSEPQFSIPDDNVIETPSQRAVLVTHFLVLFYNFYLFGSSLGAIGTITLFTIAKFIAVVVGSFVLGDFATGISIHYIYTVYTI